MKNKTVVGLTLVALLIFSGVVSSCLERMFGPRQIFRRGPLIEYPYLLSGEFIGTPVLTFQRQDAGCQVQQPLGLQASGRSNMGAEYRERYNDTPLNKDIHDKDARWRFPDGYPKFACLSTIEKVSIVSNRDFEGYPAGSELSPIAVFEILSVKDFILNGNGRGFPVQKHIIRGDDAEGWKNLELFDAREFLLRFDKCINLPQGDKSATLTITFTAGDVLEEVKDPSHPGSDKLIRHPSGVEISRTFRVIWIQ